MKKPTAPQPVAQYACIGDLINLEEAVIPTSSKPLANGFDGFEEFQDADPMKSTDDFTDFQQAQTNGNAYKNNGGLIGQSGINMQGLMDMYSQNT